MKRYLKFIYGIMMAVLLLGCDGNKEMPAATGDGTESGGIAEERVTEAEEARKDVFAMDTYMTVTAYGDRAQEAVDAAEAEIERLDSLLSTGQSTSEVARINADGGGTLSADTKYLLERSLELYESTEGAFDVAIYPVMKAWGFADGNFNVPSAETLQELSLLTDASKIDYDAENISVSFKQEGMEIDFGGIAKGYTSAKIMDIFREYGVISGCVSLGGNVQVYGTKMDGTLWRVAVQSPEGGDNYLGILSTSDRAVITSGGYERNFEQDGVTYHHIIDPATGYPANNGLTSVTIVSADGTLADGLSTSLFVMGKGKAVEYWRKNSDNFDMILFADDGNLYVSEGIKDNFASDYDMEIITRER